MTNIKALKNVYISLGGELTDTYDDIANGTPVGDMSLLADVIEAVSRKGGSGLPEVTIADDGKVLMVLAGKWHTNMPNHETLVLDARDGGIYRGVDAVTKTYIWALAQHSDKLLCLAVDGVLYPLTACRKSGLNDVLLEFGGVQYKGFGETDILLKLYTIEGEKDSTTPATKTDISVQLQPYSQGE